MLDPDKITVHPNDQHLEAQEDENAQDEDADPELSIENSDKEQQGQGLARSRL